MHQNDKTFINAFCATRRAFDNDIGSERPVILDIESLKCSEQFVLPQKYRQPKQSSETSRSEERTLLRRQWMKKEESDWNVLNRERSTLYSHFVTTSNDWPWTELKGPSGTDVRLFCIVWNVWLPMISGTELLGKSVEPQLYWDDKFEFPLLSTTSSLKRQETTWSGCT